MADDTLLFHFARKPSAKKRCRSIISLISLIKSSRATRISAIRQPPRPQWGLGFILHWLEIFKHNIPAPTSRLSLIYCSKKLNITLLIDIMIFKLATTRYENYRHHIILSPFLMQRCRAWTMIPLAYVTTIPAALDSRYREAERTGTFLILLLDFSRYWWLRASPPDLGWCRWDGG